MRTDAVLSLSPVALDAENLKAGRKLVLAEPGVHTAAAITTNCFPVLATVVVDVIDLHEIWVSFLTTRTVAAITAVRGEYLVA